MLIAVIAAAVLGQSQTPPALTAAEQQAAGQQAVASMVQIFTVLGSCERHFTPEQIAGVRRPLELERGASPTSLQQILEDGYQRGRADTTNSAAFCRRAMELLAEAKSNGDWAPPRRP